MGTIISRQRKDGTYGHTAQILIKRKGEIVHREAQTFDRREMAVLWIEKREGELAKPGALEHTKKADPPLSTAIQRYIDTYGAAMGKTKAQCLRTMKDSAFAQAQCGAIGSAEIVSYIGSLQCLPQTRGNYLSHLGAVFSIAKPAWKLPLDHQAHRDAFVVLKKMKLIAKPRERDRRPSLDELDRMMTHFADMRRRRPRSMPIGIVVCFAIFSTRREGEIVQLRWEDYDPVHKRTMVRDMKNPEEKIGNNVWCDLTPEADRLVQCMPRVDDRIFPYTTDAIQASFERAMKWIKIEDLRFHDLRHEGISRLFEMGWTIPHVAGVSGHRSWQSLKRYTQIRQRGDKFEGWPWLDKLAPRPTQVEAETDVRKTVVEA